MKTMSDIFKDFTPEMMEEMSNGLEPGESPSRNKFANLGAMLATKVLAGRSANSPLVNVTKLTPNYSYGRGGCDFERFTPHHTAGVLSVESALEWFSKTSTNASCNYVVGNDGRRGLCVEEKNRAWTSSSRDNDNRAITFEVCNSGWKSDGWPISDASYRSLVELMTDICQRHGKKKVLWISDKTKALSYRPQADEVILTKHEWFANTECPGPSLGKMFPKLAAEVTARLNTEEDDDEMVVRYKTVKEMPTWAQKDIQKLIDLGFLNGKGGNAGLDLTEDMIRMLIINGRMNGVLEV